MRLSDSPTCSSNSLPLHSILIRPSRWTRRTAPCMHTRIRIHRPLIAITLTQPNQVFTSVDERLCVNMYSFEKPGAQGSITKGEGALSLAAGQHILSFAEDLKASNGDAGLPWSPLFESASLTAHIENSPADYVKNSSPRSCK